MLNYLTDEDLQQDLPRMVVFGGDRRGRNLLLRPGEPSWTWCLGDLLGAVGRPGSQVESRFAGSDLVEVAKRIVEGVDLFSEPKIGP